MLTEPWPETTWSQRVPPTCCPIRGDAGGPEAIGVPQPTEPDALLFRVPKLGPGRYQHHYFLATVRRAPASCRPRNLARASPELGSPLNRPNCV